ncbi:response regulator [Luteimonas sp. YGD11-2]|uniref:response regulator n=1 Tax=Luteimonas sp. YGD11-2 TaxID=2508168 RepID=UPI00100B5645|nr:response regulator [Luteimonas sp. YGD11-2]
MTAGAGGPWRILLVDDSRDDAELTEIALRDAGLAFHSRRADTADTVRAALAEFDPHLVISDLNLPGFSGGEALELVRAHDPALPFVFLTGSLFVVDEPPADVHGLLLKDDLAPLPALIRRLLGG